MELPSARGPPSVLKHGLDVERLKCRLVVVPYLAAMETLDVVFVVGAGVVAGLNVAVGVAMLVRSRHQPGAIRWRGQRLVAPRLFACVHLCLGLFFSTMALSDVLFKHGSKGDDLMFLVGRVFAAGTIVTGVVWFILWFQRRSRTQHPTAQQ